MTDVATLLQHLHTLSACRVHPPCGQPHLVAAHHRIPPDLQQFYAMCGGVDLFPAAPFGFSIVAPQAFQPSNPILLGDIFIKYQADCDADSSSAWYLLASADQEHIVIDCDPSRLGRCYDAFWDVYATTDARIVARSFTALLDALLRASGEVLFWHQPTFPDLGHAYDDISSEM